MNETNTPGIARDARRRFYRAAIAGLRRLDVEEGSPRRFGADADARWKAFRGGLGQADRVDLLLRDAAVSWGAAFSPAQAFGLFGLAPDEPFGPDWQPPSDSNARSWMDEPAVSSVIELARLMGVAEAHVALPVLQPATRVAVSGGSAIARVATSFADRSDLSWSDQVVVVATSPLCRQFAGLAAVFVGAGARTRLIRPSPEPRQMLRESGFAQVDVAVVSDDAGGDCADATLRIVGVV